MKDQKKVFIEWIEVHKKQLTIAGISTLGAIVIFLGIKNKDAIIEFWKSLQMSISNAPVELPKVGSSVSKAPETRTTMMKILTETKDIAGSYTPSTSSFNVKEHLRNLPAGWHASPKKIAEAELHGIDLLPNQTFVNTYMKGGIAA